MKRITRIKLQNCRAYYDEYEIVLASGENLLIYGENGSGKSSLFKSFHQFFRNSLTTQDFIRNLYNTGTDGKLELTFSDFDQSTRNIINSQIFKFSSSNSDNTVPFIKESALLNGFLDYTDLLKIYLKSEPNPNLFDLIITNLLKEFIPVSVGSSSTLEKQYQFLIKNLITDAKTRNSRCHKLGLSKISEFDSSLRQVLNLIFELVNNYLNTYFDLKDIKIEYVLKPLKFNYPAGYKSSWHLETDLRLKVSKNAKQLGNEYKDYLNEARLSSVAICLYLASLKLFPSNIEYKLIYLDDIFIGLDTSNRIPIINILNDNFTDYQLIISTYDKNFFDVCRFKLANSNVSSLWKSVEIYVGEYEVSGDLFDIPVLLTNNDDLAKARYHLYNNQYPDYPASANYFRKYLENKLKRIFPKEVFKNEDLEEIESYKLSKIFNLCNEFLGSFNLQVKELKELHSYLFILLHPLSHYNSSTNTYKRDLKEIDKNITNIETGVPLPNITNFKFCVAKKSTVRIEFFINQYNIWYYEFYVDSHLFYSLSNDRFSNCKVICTKYYGTQNNNLLPIKKLNKSTSQISFNSINESYDNISTLILNKYRFFKKKPNIYHCVKLFNGSDWVNF